MQTDTQHTKDITTIADIVYEKLQLGSKVPVQTVMGEAKQVLSVLEVQTIEPAKVLLSMNNKVICLEMGHIT